ncbi:hypothetical protein COJ70_18125 [Priestia megaterium]|uniref:O-antigen polymerase n=1 Tax=Priestia megaterium TaxID=1404 RepID=UPI000BF973B7|nr:O-antigen polymerase [Priestia megaterium]PFO15347.1 hypothetical protein COJ70_18125 [Priestia megaterium]
MTIWIVLETFIFSIINYIYFKRFFNFASVFIFMWCAVSVLSSFGFYGLYVPPSKTYIYIMITIAAFEVSLLLFLKVRINIQTQTEVIKLNWRRVNFISILCTVLILPFAMKGMVLVLSEGFYRLRLSGFSNLLYSTSEKLILMNVIQPLVLAISILSLIELIENKKVRISLVLSALNCLQYIFVFGGRWILLEFLLLAGIILYDTYGVNIIKLIKNNKLIMVIITTIILLIAIITSQRSVGGGEGFLYNIYVYFVGSIHLFGVYISDPSKYALTSQDLLFGRAFFAGILEPFYLIVKFGGFNWKSGIEIINEVTQQFVFVSPATYMNNNVTMIYAFLRDFGFFGLIICPFILGAYYSYIYMGKRQSSSIYRKGMYYYCLSIMPFLLFEWMPARLSIVLVPFCLYILTRRHFQSIIKIKR